MFREIKPFKSEPVTVANGNPCEVKGIGDVPLETIVDGKTVKILMSNTLYVPDFSINLISVGMLLERGIFTVFDKSGTGCTIKDDNDEIFARGTKCSENSRLFEIKMSSSNSNKSGNNMQDIAASPRGEYNRQENFGIKLKDTNSVLYTEQQQRKLEMLESRFVPLNPQKVSCGASFSRVVTNKMWF